jgi:hypothetical protein
MAIVCLAVKWSLRQASCWRVLVIKGGAGWRTTEKDLLGEKQIPADAYHGVQTARGCPQKCIYCTYPLLEVVAHAAVLRKPSSAMR